MADLKRPQPLSDDLIFDHVPISSSVGGATLLGRTGVGAAISVDAALGLAKKPQPLAAEVHSMRPTPIPTPQNSWCFTPIATPSPAARFSRCFSAQDPQSRTRPAEPPITWAAPPPPAASAPVAPAPAAPMTHKVSLEQALRPVAPPPAEDSDDDDTDSPDDSDVEEIGRAVAHANAPRRPPGAPHPSRGSEGHAVGACKRCCFFPRGRCANGYDCMFCHYEHEKRKRKNKKKLGRKTPMMPASTIRMPAMAAGGSTYMSWSLVPQQHLQHPVMMLQAPGGLGVPPHMHQQQPHAQYQYPQMREACYIVGGTGPASGLPLMSNGLAPPQASPAPYPGSQVIMLEPAFSSQRGRIEQRYLDIPPPPPLAPMVQR